MSLPTRPEDLRPHLDRLRLPTLLLHHTDDPWLSVEHSRDVATRIADAKFVELPGVDHWPWIGDMGAVPAEIPAHRTGWKAQQALATRLPDSFPNAVGSQFELRAR